MTTIYRAEWLLPITAPPVKNGAVAVDGERIVAVGSLPDGARRLPGRDHGRLRPGRADARLRQRPQPPRVHELPRHVRRPAVRRLDHQPDRRQGLAHARRVPVERPARRPRGAVVGGHHGRRHHLHRRRPSTAAAEAGLRGVAYLEVFGVDDKRLDETLADLDERLAGRRHWPARGSRSGSRRTRPTPCRAACSRPSPTSPASVDMKVASHVAESKEEVTYIRSGSGKFAHDYREKMGWERMLIQPYGVSPIKYLQQWGVFDEDFLAVHCVHASIDDIRILKAKRVAVAHCPKSNAKTGCGIAPLPDLLRLGVRVGFGTDSPAASNIMDMFDEMRTALFLHRGVERDVGVLNARAVHPHRHTRRGRGARPGRPRRLARARQAGRPHRRRRLGLALRADRRPLLGAGLRRQPGRRAVHLRGRRGSLSRRRLPRARRAGHARREPPGARQAAGEGRCGAGCRSAPPNRDGGTRRPRRIKGRPDAAQPQTGEVLAEDRLRLHGGAHGRLPDLRLFGRRLELQQQRRSSTRAAAPSTSRSRPRSRPSRRIRPTATALLGAAQGYQAAGYSAERRAVGGPDQRSHQGAHLLRPLHQAARRQARRGGRRPALQGPAERDRHLHRADRLQERSRAPTRRCSSSSRATTTSTWASPPTRSRPATRRPRSPPTPPSSSSTRTRPYAAQVKTALAGLKGSPSPSATPVSRCAGAPRAAI